MLSCPWKMYGNKNVKNTLTKRLTMESSCWQTKPTLDSLRTIAVSESLILELYLYKEFIRYCDKLCDWRTTWKKLICFASIFLKVSSCESLRKNGTSVRITPCQRSWSKITSASWTAIKKTAEDRWRENIIDIWTILETVWKSYP